MERVREKRKGSPRIKSGLKEREEWNDIVNSLFQQIRCSVVTIEGYTSILSDQYSQKMDRKMKHYIRRIMKNLEKVDHGLCVLHECLNNRGGNDEGDNNKRL